MLHSVITPYLATNVLLIVCGSIKMGTGNQGPTRKAENGSETAISLTINRFPCNKSVSCHVESVLTIFLAAVETLYQWDVWSYNVGEEAQS